MNGLPRLPAQPCTFGHTGGCLCHLISWTQTSSEEIQDLYYEVCKLRRLPRSLPCGPEWADTLARDMVSSLKNCLRWKEDEPSGAAQAAHTM